MQPFRPWGACLVAALAVACAGPVPDSAPAARASSPQSAAPPAYGPELPADLDALLAQAERSSPELLAAFAQWTAAGQRSEQADEWPDPKLRVTWWAQELQTRAGPADARIMATQRIPWPGKRGAAAEVADALGAAAGARLQALRLDLRRRITRTWNERVRLARERAILAGHLGLLHEVEGVARAAAERANTRPAGLMRVQVDIGRITDRIAALDETAARTIATLEALVGAPLAADSDWQRADFSVAGVAPGDAAPEADLADLEGHPLLEGLARSAQAAQSGVEVATLAARPDFELSVDYTFVGDSGAPGVTSGEDPISLSFGIDLPLSGGADRARRLEARALHRVRLAELRTAHLALEERLQSALSMWRDARRRELLYGEELLPQADEAFAIAVASYQARTAPFGEVVETARDLLTLRLEALRAVADRAQSGADLDALLLTAPETRER